MRPSTITHDAPPTPWILYWAARLWFWVFGWEVVGDVPPFRKGVLIAAPHTSNWDLPHMLATSLVFRVRLSWLGKHTLFKFPFGWFMRTLGGLAVDRSSPKGTVGQVAALLRDADRLVVAVPPSGTRSKRDHWKGGFYWIAHEAQVPVVCAYLDYRQRRAGLGFHFVPTGDVRADMARVRTFYADIRGRFPESESTVYLLEEDPKPSEDAEHAGPA